MVWHYNGKEITELSQFPENTFGFVYKITHTPSGKAYIGKKVLYHNRKVKVTKKELVNTNPIKDFKRSIIKLAPNKKLLTYYETQYQFMYQVLEKPDEFFNYNILGKFFTKDFDSR